MKSYKTVISRADDEFIEKKSRFIGHVCPCETAEEALAFLDEMRNKYKDASHNCFAYIIGENKGIMRYSDDGEPGGTAGMPIIEVMKKSDVTNCCVVVTRYFGGILLGAGGLTRAYARGAQIALAAGKVGVMHPTTRFMFDVAYPMLSKIEYWLASQPVIIESKDFTANITFTAIIKTDDAEKFTMGLSDVSQGTIETLTIDEFFKAWDE